MVLLFVTYDLLVWRDFIDFNFFNLLSFSHVFLFLWCFRFLRLCGVLMRLTRLHASFVCASLRLEFY